MKLYELQQLDEGLMQRVLAAATLAAGMLITPTANTPELPADMVQAIGQRTGMDKQAMIAKMAAIASDKYHADPAMVKQVVQLAVKYSYPDFPTAKDLLAVVGVESSFNPNAVSKLKHDPARGLLQVRPGVWGMKPQQLSTIEDQIKMGAKVLRSYYKRFGSREAALHAFNVGPKNHIKSAKQPNKGNPRYVPKVDAEERLYAELER